MNIETISRHKVFGGTLSFVKHESRATDTPMTYSIFVPKGEGPFCVVYWLSGLTCRAHNFSEKAGAYAKAAELGLIIVVPDTSPRGEGVADDNSYDLGQGAGFYLNATQMPWKTHFQMETYITRDLISSVEAHFPASDKRSIFGHSMGGHGALILAMNYPELYTSVSAFAPIVSPLRCQWGQKAFMAYLGEDQSLWEAYDATALLALGKARSYDDILIDQGLSDEFLSTQLKPDLLEAAADNVGQKLTLRYHEGYDHSYYFIQSFVGDHLAFHAQRLA